METNPLITSLSIVNNLSFITLGNFIRKIVKTLEKVIRKTMEWKILNIVIYNISKIETVFFSNLFDNSLMNNYRKKNQS